MAIKRRIVNGPSKIISKGSSSFKLFSFPTSRSSAAFLCLTVNLPPTNILEEVVAAAAVVVDDDDVEDDWGGMEDGVGRRADVINFGKNKFLEFQHDNSFISRDAQRRRQQLRQRHRLSEPTF